MEGIYVIELAPDRVKVGRSASLVERMREHEKAFRQTGAAARQCWSCAVEGSTLVETRLLAALDRLPFAIRAPGQREVFAGVSFLEVVTLALSICQTFPVPHARPFNLVERAPGPTSDIDLVAAALTAMDQAGLDRMPTADLAAAVGIAEGGAVIAFGRTLAGLGASSQRWRVPGGPAMRGFTRNDLLDVLERAERIRAQAWGTDTADHG